MLGIKISLARSSFRALSLRKSLWLFLEGVGVGERRGREGVGPPRSSQDFKNKNADSLSSIIIGTFSRICVKESQNLNMRRDTAILTVCSFAKQ